MNKELIHRVIEGICSFQSDKIAIDQSGIETSYGTMNVQANRQAHLLSALGCDSSTVVGVCLASGSQSVISILSCFKSGSVYMPLDLDFSPGRIGQMLSETRPSVLIMGMGQQARAESLLSRLGLGVPYLVVHPDLELLSGFSEDAQTLLGQQDTLQVYAYSEGRYDRISLPSGGVLWDENLTAEPDGHSDSYIFYTSGSTGSGKGIVGSHRSLSHYIHWQVREWGVDSNFRVSHIAAVTFDASLKDILVPLSSGARLCIPGVGMRHNMDRLSEWLSESGVTQLQCVPSVFRLLMQSLRGRSVPALPSLRYVLLAGERLYGRDLSQWKAINGTVSELTNLYGLTETTILKSFYRIPDREWQPGEVIPVGHAISNTSIAVISGNRLSSRETVGDIYIKSPFMSKGYVDRRLNGGVFVQNPLVTDREDIVCRTGDLGRYRSDGVLEILGRKDEQVKLHGIRIELGEVRCAMLDIAGIDQVEVLVYEREEEQSLVCYYTGTEQVPSELREKVSEKLNSYMIPSYFEWLESFPLNVNGKVDRKQLPVPGELESKLAYEAPQGEYEEKLAAIWRDVLLGKDRIGRNASFFNIGGSSLKAVQLISRIYKELDVQLQIGQIFSHPILSAQAELVGGALHEAYRLIPNVGEASDYALSHSQKRIWILDQLQPGMVAYSRPIAYKLSGALNRLSLENSFRTLIARHESLRTVFTVTADGEPRQRILSPSETGFELEYADLTGTSDPVQQALIETEQEGSRPFDLSCGPLLRVKLLQVGPSEYYFLFTIHHIISDEWSMQVLVREVLSLYNAYIHGDPNPLSALRIQYKDYAGWQQDQLSGEALKSHQSYWHGQLSGELPVLDLPTDRSRPPVQSYRGDRVGKDLGHDLSVGLGALGKEQGATLFMVLLAGLNTLLYRYTGQQDMIIGSPIAGREHADLDEQIGFYVNTLALRSHVNGNGSFTELLEQVKETALGAFAHQSYPFDRLVEELEVVRDPSRSPLFNVMLVVDSGRIGEIPSMMKEVSITPETIEATTSLFDLTFSFTESGSGQYLSIEYNTDLYERDRIWRLFEHFERLLRAITLSPSTAIGDLSYLSELERADLLYRYNDTSVPYREESTLVSLFERTAESFSGSTAIVQGDTSLSYEELNRRSNQLAHYLVSSYGIGKDDRVGVMSGRNEWLPVILLGILKSGGAYLPIDPDYPQERINYMLSDASSVLLLTDGSSEVYTDVRQVDVRGLWPELSGYSGENPVTGPSPTDLAYVIYTSGSSGRPKGVMVEHKAVVNYLAWVNQYYFNKSSRNFGVFTSYSFDLTVTGLFSSLLNGDTLHIWENKGTEIIEMLEMAFSNKEITALKLTPSHLNLFKYLKNIEQTSVRWIIVGGEALNIGQINKIRESIKGIKIFNEYGPTETTVGCTAIEIDGENVSIGKPISNVQVYVLNEREELQPEGIIGEICISGAGLARGYLNQPELTAEKFVSNPYVSGALMYKTGDLGRWLPGGKIEYIGRKDDQVKIRGYRIEPDEISRTLEGHSSIRQALVIVHKNSNGEKELTAYFISESVLQTKDLRSFLSEKLPLYMLPSYYIQLDEIPLTNNGKIDKHRLPNPGMSGDIISEKYVAARTNTEKKLVEIWEGLLNSEKIGVRDSLFELGGSSLKAIQLIARIHKEMSLKLDLIMLFNYPTIESLGEQLDLIEWAVNVKDPAKFSEQATDEITID